MSSVFSCDKREQASVSYYIEAHFMLKNLAKQEIFCLLISASVAVAGEGEMMNARLAVAQGEELREYGEFPREDIPAVLQRDIRQCHAAEAATCSNAPNKFARISKFVA
jgi:hypothetical protein